MKNPETITSIVTECVCGRPIGHKNALARISKFCCKRCKKNQGHTGRCDHEYKFTSSRDKRMPTMKTNDPLIAAMVTGHEDAAKK